MPDAETEKVLARQISALVRNAPVAISAGFINALLIAIVALQEAPTSIVGGWLACTLLVLAIAARSWQRNRSRVVRRASANAIKRATRSALVSGLPWAALLPLFYPAASVELKVVIIAISAGMACGGAVSLSHVPSAAQAFLGLIAASTLATTIFCGGLSNYVLAVATLLYCVALCLMINTLARLSSQNSRSLIEIERQNQMIGFLLKDFEESVSDWLWETDHNGQITYLSERMCQVTGLDRAAILGKSLAYWATDGGSDEGWRAWDRHTGLRHAYRDLLLPTTVGGEQRFWTITARPLFDEDGQFLGYRGVAADVTLAQAAETMRLAKDQAERANAAKSRFLAVMSHELRTPLNSIIGFAELISRELHGPAGHKEYVDYAKIIMASSHHLLSIINEVLEMARSERAGETINETEFAVRDLVHSAASFVAHAARDGQVDVKIGYIDDALCLRADVRLLRQLLLNLLSNAIKFTDRGGTIAIATGIRPDRTLAISIEDTGCGVPADKLSEIFEPFVQADDNLSRKAGGIGLGLSIAAQIAKAHTGTLHFESVEREGSKATLILPASRVLYAGERDLPLAASA